MNNSFIYSVLQYKHSLALGEALNIGVLFSFPDENRVHFVAGNTQRIKCVYPNFDIAIFTKISRSIKNNVEQGSRIISPFTNKKSYSFKEYIDKEILPEDATSLQFTEPLTAVNDLGNSNKAIDEFAKLLLPDTEDTIEIIRHNEPYILRRYTDKLTSKVNKPKMDNLLRRDVEIKTKKASLTFEYGWDNERLLHLVKPISFDLTSEYFIQEKSVKYWGHLSLLNQYAEDNNLFFDLLIAAPQEPELSEAYNNALDTLYETVAPKRIITEDKLEEYSEETAVNLNKDRL